MQTKEKARHACGGQLEAMYQRIIEYEAMVNAPGRERRLERLSFEVEAWRNRMTVDAAVKRAAAVTQRVSLEVAVAAPAPRQAPLDDFRASIPPPCTAESVDWLRIEVDDRKRRLIRFNLAESAARRLDNELARADGPAAQLAVLDRWLAGAERAVRTMELVVAGRDVRAQERADLPPPRAAYH